MKESLSCKRAEMPGGASAVLETRTLENSNANLLKVLKEGQYVLDVGCGSGAITEGIVKYVGNKGKVTGVDRSNDLIQLAKERSGDYGNLFFEAVDILDYNPRFKFDIITTARTLQWIESPEQVIKKLVTLLNPSGKICVLDYNHNLLEWDPAPPSSMQHFYSTFLKWRADAGMDNAIGDNVAMLLQACKGTNIEVTDQSEYLERGMEGFDTHISIWLKVAETRGIQLVNDKYIDDPERLKAIREYAAWMKEKAQSMRLYLKATHATFGDDLKNAEISCFPIKYYEK